MPYVIRVLGFANGTACPHAGEYLKSVDLEFFNGRGFMLFTRHQKRALQFPTQEEAMRAYMASPRCKPLREDGLPNRPLTAATVEILPLGAAPL